jgi:hypothetical protein
VNTAHQIRRHVYVRKKRPRKRTACRQWRRTRRVGLDDDEHHTSPSLSRPSHALTAPLLLICDLSETPQWPWKEWCEDEAHLIQMTCLNLTELNWVYDQCRQPLLSLRLSMRQRHENAVPLSSHNLLCVTLYWLRKYPSFDDMVALFQHGRRYLHDVVRDVVRVMDAHIVNKLIRPIDHTSPISTRSTLQHVKILVDSTFLPLPKSPFLPSHYHQKSPTKTAWKFEVACGLSHRIVSVSKAYRGAVHDMSIIRESGVLQQASASALILGDKRYGGPLGIVTPLKKNRKRSRELLALEETKVKEHELESERSAIENLPEGKAVAYHQWSVQR